MAVDGFRFSRPQEVVLRDLDGFGHVNNAVFLTYVENARVSYLREVVGARYLEEIRNVMARVEIDFRAEVSYGEELESWVRTERIGGKSFNLHHRIVREDGELAAEARTVQVMYDMEERRGIEVPADWRAAIARYDGLEGDGSS